MSRLQTSFTLYLILRGRHSYGGIEYKSMLDDSYVLISLLSSRQLLHPDFALTSTSSSDAQIFLDLYTVVLWYDISNSIPTVQPPPPLLTTSPPHVDALAPRPSVGGGGGLSVWVDSPSV